MKFMNWNGLRAKQRCLSVLPRTHGDDVRTALRAGLSVSQERSRRGSAEWRAADGQWNLLLLMLTQDTTEVSVPVPDNMLSLAARTHSHTHKHTHTQAHINTRNHTCKCTRAQTHSRARGAARTSHILIF